MKYLMKLENLSEREYTVKLWCYNNCKCNDEWLSSISVAESVVIDMVKEYRKDIKDYKHQCRKRFWITVNGKRVTTLEKLKLELIANKYNL